MRTKADNDSGSDSDSGWGSETTGGPSPATSITGSRRENEKAPELGHPDASFRLATGDYPHVQSEVQTLRAEVAALKKEVRRQYAPLASPPAHDEELTMCREALRSAAERSERLEAALENINVGLEAMEEPHTSAGDQAPAYTPTEAEHTEAVPPTANSELNQERAPGELGMERHVAALQARVGVLEGAVAALHTQLSATTGLSLVVGGIVCAMHDTLGTVDRGIKDGLAAAHRGLVDGLAVTDQGLKHGFAAADRGIKDSLAATDRHIKGGLAAADQGLKTGLAAADQSLKGTLTATNEGISFAASQAHAGLANFGAANAEFWRRSFGWGR